ncbi:MAG: arginine repressor [Huintestinicola sp.]
MKAFRHEKILQIIKETPVETQDMLRDLLAERKIEVTQATLSRDIKELGLRKTVDDNGVLRYSVPEKTDTEIPQIFMEAVIGVDYAGNIVLFKCHTGMAQAVCITFDKQKYPEVLGTIAGDDTIFILMRSEKGAAAFVKEMGGLIFNREKGDSDAQ